jgi:hypothetical protein
MLFGKTSSRYCPFKILRSVYKMPTGNSLACIKWAYASKARLSLQYCTIWRPAISQFFFFVCWLFFCRGWKKVSQVEPSVRMAGAVSPHFKYLELQTMQSYPQMCTRLDWLGVDRGPRWLKIRWAPSRGYISYRCTQIVLIMEKGMEGEVKTHNPRTT